MTKREGSGDTERREFVKKLVSRGKQKPRQPMQRTNEKNNVKPETPIEDCRKKGHHKLTVKGTKKKTSICKQQKENKRPSTRKKEGCDRGRLLERTKKVTIEHEGNEKARNKGIQQNGKARREKKERQIPK